MPRPDRKWVLLALAAAAAVVAVPGIAQTGGDSLVMSGDPPEMFLMYTGDVIGFIEPCG